MLIKPPTATISFYLKKGIHPIGYHENWLSVKGSCMQPNHDMMFVRWIYTKHICLCFSKKQKMLMSNPIIQLSCPSLQNGFFLTDKNPTRKVKTNFPKFFSVWDQTSQDIASPSFYELSSNQASASKRMTWHSELYESLSYSTVVT